MELNIDKGILCIPNEKVREKGMFIAFQYHQVTKFPLTTINYMF